MVLRAAACCVPAMFALLLLTVALLAGGSTAVVDAAAPKNPSPLAPFLPRRGFLGFGKKKYTPLLFFTAPKGEMSECDYMEEVVSDIEKELNGENTKVERFDIVRDPYARLLFDKIDASGKQVAPLLYHRESRQLIYGPTDKNRVRAWAKGRWLSANYRPTLPKEMFKGAGGDDEAEAGDEGDGEEEGGELMEDDSHLSSRQKEGKESMKRRLEKGFGKKK